MNISNETHVLVEHNVEYTFELFKLPYRTGNVDYIVYWNQGASCAFYGLLWKEFYYVTSGSKCSNISFKEKPKDKPWTAEDAIKHFNKMVRRADNHGLCHIKQVTESGIYDGNYFLSYKDMMEKKCYVESGHSVPAYKKA